MLTERVIDTVDIVRGRVMRLKQGRSFEKIGADIGLKPGLLMRFLNGQMVRPETLAQIEKWCESQMVQGVHHADSNA